MIGRGKSRNEFPVQLVGNRGDPKFQKSNIILIDKKDKNGEFRELFEPPICCGDGSFELISDTLKEIIESNSDFILNPDGSGTVFFHRMKPLSKTNRHQLEDDTSCNDVHPINCLKDWKVFVLSSVLWCHARKDHPEHPKIEVGFANLLIGVKSKPCQRVSQLWQLSLRVLQEQEGEPKGKPDLSEALLLGHDETLRLLMSKTTHKKPDKDTTCFIDKQTQESTQRHGEAHCPTLAS